MLQQDGLILEQIQIGPMDNFTYLLGCKRTREVVIVDPAWDCLLYTSPSPRDRTRSRMPSSA